MALKDHGMAIASSILCMQHTPISHSEFQLLEKKVESLGESLSKDRLENRAAIDELKIEIATLRRALEGMSPALAGKIRGLREEIIREYDPESSEANLPAASMPQAQAPETPPMIRGLY
jgi:hypothetical protein